MDIETRARAKGPFLAIASAALFGVSPVFGKILVGEVSPILLAGLLYLGSGIALLGSSIAAGNRPMSFLVRLSLMQKWKLLGAIASGGVIAPLLLTFGLKYGTAFETSVLLNLETVTTTLIAYFVFREHVSSHLWVGKIFLIAGAALILYTPGEKVALSTAGLLVLGACVFWGLDNNLTRDIEELPPSILAGTKGMASGAFNVVLAAVIGKSAISGGALAASLAVGALSYGVSLVLFVKSLRLLGASRTSTYFATGPLWGMLLALLVLGERPTLIHGLAAVFMGIGACVLYLESHTHEHSHERLVHRHKHIHDEHHQHGHDGSEGPEPHDHLHTHEPMIHSHWHLPDIHHRHSHR